MEDHAKEVAAAVHVWPLVEEYQIPPPFTVALANVPLAEMAIADHANAVVPAVADCNQCLP